MQTEGHIVVTTEVTQAGGRAGQVSDPSKEARGHAPRTAAEYMSGAPENGAAAANPPCVSRQVLQPAPRTPLHRIRRSNSPPYQPALGGVRKRIPQSTQHWSESLNAEPAELAGFMKSGPIYVARCAPNDFSESGAPDRNRQ